MTGKDIYKKFQQEQFDVKGYKAVIELQDGTRLDIYDIELDEVEHQIKFVAVVTETEGD